MPDVRVGSVDIRYETIGDPGDPAQLLIMGLGALVDRMELRRITGDLAQWAATLPDDLLLLVPSLVPLTSS
ncbi:hypothetical protein [Actinoplanes auranticolor]|uniref:Alpha/beta hydrolase n=1 Tax=Actinoplanes auranticolor TaxID=47988 RepID=A0A919VJY0_9ACTN|nr:hypothetical protein [Actinoplanes auranticolor]GIM65956.1 hypothetical protein Aau02nite_20920 [Actinoplanes auranticolor]